MKKAIPMLALISLALAGVTRISLAVDDGRKISAENVRAAYLTSGHLNNQTKISYILQLIKDTELNAVVIDVKESALFLKPHNVETVKLFKKHGIYTIGRFVVFQDSVLARQKPHLAIKTRGGDLWYSGRASWKRYWVDPASSEVTDYNIAIAKKVIDAGFDEINFDYIRFPSDGNMRDMVYPTWDGTTPKYAIMKNFFAKLRRELKAYKPDVMLSIDVFGYVYQNGAELGIGQRIEDAAEYFDVLSPMPYPSHYRCREFGVADPNAEPYLVYNRTLAAGLSRIEKMDMLTRPITRPWIQDFSIGNIYGCGARVKYGTFEIKEQIRAVRENKVNGYMLWNPSSVFTRDALTNE